VGRVLGTLTRAKASWLRLTAVPHLPGAEHVPPVASDQSLEPWICLNLDNARTSRRLNFNSPNCRGAAVWRASTGRLSAPDSSEARARLAGTPLASSASADQFGKSQATFSETRRELHRAITDLGDVARAGRAGGEGGRGGGLIRVTGQKAKGSGGLICISRARARECFTGRLSGAARRKMTAGIYGAVKAASSRASLFYDSYVNTSTSARVYRCFITSWRPLFTKSDWTSRARRAIDEADRVFKRNTTRVFVRSRLLLIGQTARDLSRDGVFAKRTLGACV